MLPVWVTPEHLVSTARIVIQGHRLSHLPVVGANGVVGFVTPDAIALAEPDRTVEEFIQPFQLVLNGGMSVREATARFVQLGVEAAPVEQEGKFLGLITALDLLRELSQVWDPLTELPWIERLREWSIDQLDAGQEITLLCLDVDDFGLYNRRYGHVQGDVLLRRLADQFRSATESRLDIVARSGGDEFVVGTIRPLADAQQLISRLREAISPEKMPEVFEPVTISAGIAGGKRTQDREHVHHAAMFENLVKLAQADCQAHKRLKPSVITGAGLKSKVTIERGEEFEVISVARHTEPQPLTQVIIRIGSRIVGGVDGGEESELAVANATARALESWSRAMIIVIESVQRFDDAGGSHLISVTGSLSIAGEATRLAGSARYDVDALSATAEAVLDAFARTSSDGGRVPSDRPGTA
jgi:diguanylate cyclase (GGDEF)-like protein